MDATLLLSTIPTVGQLLRGQAICLNAKDEEMRPVYTLCWKTGFIVQFQLEWPNLFPSITVHSSEQFKDAAALKEVTSLTFLA